MPRKPTKAQKEKASASEVIDRIFAEVDPEVLLAGLLGGIAATGGITPPIARLMNSTSDLESAASKFKDIVTSGLGFGDQAYLFWPWLLGVDSDGNKSEAAVSMRAMAAEGVLEGMALMALAKNPAAMQALASVLANSSSGASALLKGVV